MIFLPHLCGRKMNDYCFAYGKVPNFLEARFNTLQKERGGNETGIYPLMSWAFFESDFLMKIFTNADNFSSSETKQMQSIFCTLNFQFENFQNTSWVQKQFIAEKHSTYSIKKFGPVINPPKLRQGEIREKVQLPLCRHCLRWNFGPIK